jgi:hypothetical protein
MGVAGIADLIIATSQFAAVDSVIKAIRAADKEAAAESTSQPTTNRDATSEYHRPADSYDPQQVTQLAPTYMLRPTYYVSAPHSVPTEKHQPICVVNVIVVQPIPVANEQPLQPPWKVLPWENPVQTAPKVKVVYRPPDINHRAGGLEYRGADLDLFI